LYEEREKRLSAGVEDLAKNLERVYRVSERPTAEIFTGLDGMKAILSEELAAIKPGGEILYYRIQPDIAWALPVFVSWYHKQRGKKGIRARAIFDSSPSSLKRVREFLKLPAAEIRVLVEELPSPISYHVCGDALAILSFSGKDSIGILIKSKEISSFFRQNFDFAWRKLKPFQ
jgi:hypothetical protein